MSCLLPIMANAATSRLIQCCFSSSCWSSIWKICPQIGPLFATASCGWTSCFFWITPWISRCLGTALSRTRHRLADKVFDECFHYSLRQCAQAALVDGQIQAIDTAYVEANASLDTLEAKKIANWTLDVNQETLQPAPEKVSFVKANQQVNPKRVARNNRTHQSLTDPQARLATKPHRRPGR